LAAYPGGLTHVNVKQSRYEKIETVADVCSRADQRSPPSPERHMSPVTIFLAKFLGLYCIILALANLYMGGTLILGLYLAYSGFSI